MAKLVLIAGRPSHPPGAHEHRAGMLLLARCLRSVPGLDVEVHDQGWVASEAAFEGASGVAIFADGGVGHPLLLDGHLGALARLVEEGGIGIGLMHYALELPEGKGGERVDAWIGGHYCDGRSCNPIWEAQVDTVPGHPVARGVGPFVTTDEWYLGIEFAGGPGSVTPILQATPSDAVRAGPYVWPAGPYPHIVAASGRAETLLWVHERADGGRAFGCTGGHFHANWADDAFRMAVLNALVWIAGVEVPSGGVASSLRPGDLDRDLDRKP
jgi:hypothetical protein